MAKSNFSLLVEYLFCVAVECCRSVVVSFQGCDAEPSEFNSHNVHTILVIFFFFKFFFFNFSSRFFFRVRLGLGLG